MRPPLDGIRTPPEAGTPVAPTPAFAAAERAPAGGYVTLDSETYYRISDYDRMPPFLMTVASDTDLWMFVTSGGGLTAGRRDPDGALFPYETVDKLHDGHHHTGPITLLRVRRERGAATLWQPFGAPGNEPVAVERHLYKNVAGNRLVFEEIRRDLGLAFRYRWAAAEAFGWIRTATIENLADRPAALEVLDGLRNLLPHGAPLALLQHSSGLVDAYKRADRDPGTTLAIYSLTAKITDRPEAAEELRANVAWCHGLPSPRVGLSLEAVEAFRRSEPLVEEPLVTGRRGHYLVASSFELPAHGSVRWHVAADAGRDHAQVVSLLAVLRDRDALGARVEQALRDAGESLVRSVGSADGLQLTGDPVASAHHFSNVLFNIMRGGVFAKHHLVPSADLAAFVHARSRAVAARHAGWLAALPSELPVEDLLRRAESADDAGLVRLCHEYLPITFGRRHGDPSRPWNRFDIRLRNPDGSRALHYEGNWRDIFQNWEALGASFPGFLPGFIAKFVNASTVDGFNPYRITRDGVDWEVPDPADPWSHIGYWGDHQVVYLLRLLEALRRTSPGTLDRLMARECFAYADVPYRLKPYAEILENPRATIVYDEALAARIAARVAADGADGQLARDRDGAVLHVSLAEKLLVPALSKLSNFVPGGGIWMNTQRPEWNDANNALAGNGVSVVTLFQLRRYLAHLAGAVEGRAAERFPVSAEVVTWFGRLDSILAEDRGLLDAAGIDDTARLRLVEALGRAFSDYRGAVYARGLSPGGGLTGAEIAAFCRRAIEHVDHTLRANRREDGLYHSYNLIELSADRTRIALRRLPEMLEGQVAALASGVVGPDEASRLVGRLFASRLYRADQDSFMLYPEKSLPTFLEKNVVPDAGVEAVPLLRELLAAGDRSIVARDAAGVHRFHADLRSAAELAAALDRLASEPRWAAGVARDRQAVQDAYEAVFHHHAFTGRSGTMYAYEGIGCIYWHMVAKLLLAVQEQALDAARDGAPAAQVEALAEAYHRIRGGLGFTKSPAEYGAFPTDPYSHTPPRAGAQQPGMTGQVKEEILARFGELGVRVENGLVSFRPVLMRGSELRTEPGAYRYEDVGGIARTLEVPAGALAFSLCGVPVRYQRSRDAAWVRVTRNDGTSHTTDAGRLDAATSASLLGRRGEIAHIDVGLPESDLRDRR